MTKEERAYAVLNDPRFYRAALEHRGNATWGSPMEARFEIGLQTEPGTVRWIYSETAEKAFEQAARVLIDGERIAAMPDYAG